jgi:hypothetical protein
MKRITILALCLFLAAGTLVASAQEASQPPHKVLVVAREYLKPGRGGLAHDKAESAFVQAFARANWPTHYIGLTSLTGRSRALFFLGYDSFEAWEKDNMAIQKNATLSAALDHAGFVDGELLESMENAVFMYREDYSLRPNADLTHRRYIETSLFHVRPGHRKEWDDGMKMVLAAYGKGVPSAHWACYEIMYGLQDSTFLFLIGRVSTAEVDKSMIDNKDFATALGEEGMKKLEALTAEAVESSETNLFAINPRLSYVSDDVIKGDPDFWSVKPPAAPAHKKAAAKAPAAQ